MPDVDNLAIKREDSLGERVAHELRVQVISGRLRPGTHLVEGQLAERFDVSRGPVRDALRRLEAEGLVASQRRGVYVTGLDAEDVEELYTLRESLESLALTLAMDKARDADWARSQACVERMRQAADRADARLFAEADLDFHSRFYELSGHRRLIAVWEQYRPTFAVVLDITNAQDVDLHSPAENHAALLGAARRGDREAALAALRAHLGDARDQLRSALRDDRSRAEG